jgi:hypothetical protein
LNYKYRSRRVCYKGSEHNSISISSRKTITEYRTPERKESDLVFAIAAAATKKMPYIFVVYT